MKKYFKISIIAAVTCFSMVSCSDDEVIIDRPIGGMTNPFGFNLSINEMQIVKKNNDFGFRLLKEVAKSDEFAGKSFVISPVSAYLTFAQLANGAEGKTRDKIAEVLGFSSSDIDEINKLNERVMNQLLTVDRNTTTNLANSIWTNPDMYLIDDFRSASDLYYNAEIKKTNDLTFTNDLNEWCKENTDMNIPNFIEDIDAAPDFALCSAIYFKGRWAQADQMDILKMAVDNYTDGNGNISIIKYMRNKKDFRYGETETIQKCGLRYGNTAYIATFIIPKDGVTMEQAFDALANGEWGLITCHNYDTVVDLSLPCFKIESMISLEDMAEGLGLSDIFNNQDADFSNITKSGTIVQMAKQRASIEVNEKNAPIWPGFIPDVTTESDHNVIMKFNRPFIYVVHEESTGAVLLAGCVNSIS